MSRKYEDYKEAAFVKLLEVYDPNEKINSDNECNKNKIEFKTKTVERKYFNKFSDIFFNKDNIITLPKGGVSISYLYKNEIYIALVGAYLIEDKLDQFNSNNFSYIREEGKDPALFILLAKEFSPYIKLKEEYSTESSVMNILDAAEEVDFEFDLLDIINYHENIHVFKIKDGVIKDNKIDMEEVIISLLINLPSLLHFHKKQNNDEKEYEKYLEIINQIINYESDKKIKYIDRWMMLNSISSYYNRHVFLDIYRCLEKIFYFPEVYELSRKISEETKKTLDIETLKLICKNNLSWQPKENISIKKLLQIIFLEGDNNVFYQNSEKICNDFIKDMSITFKENDDINIKKVGKISEYIYMYRNSLVHHEDKEYKNLKKLTEEEWLKIASFIANALLFFSQKFNKGKAEGKSNDKGKGKGKGKGKAI